MDRRVYKDAKGKRHDPLELRLQPMTPHFVIWYWKQRERVIASGLAEAVLLYGIPRHLSYLDWVACVFAAPVMRERQARNVQKGVEYANGQAPPADYHEMSTVDRKAAEAAEDEARLTEIMRA